MFSALFLCSAALSLSSVKAAPPTPAAQNLLRSIPLRFEANAGQWNRAVRYSARAAGYQLFLTGREAVLALDGRTVTMSLAGSNTAASLQADDRLPFMASYLVGTRNNWRTGVPQFGRVRRNGVYPGIDVVYYGNGTQLEYDFVLQPNADPGRIRMQFRGADRLSLTAGGDLLVEVGESRFVQKRPSIYQEHDGTRSAVRGGYRLLARNVVGVAVGAYDRDRALTIDPVLSYASLIGGSGSDGVSAVQVDRNGNLYVAGYIQNNDLQGNDSSFASQSKGGTDGFLAIIDPRREGADSLRYFTYLGGSAADRINAIAVDGIGNVYLAGSTTSFDFPLAGTGIQQGRTGEPADGFVTKLDPRVAGAEGVLYSTYIGGAQLDEANAVEVDGSGRIYVVGTTRSDQFPVTPSAYAGVRWGNQDAFLMRINPDSSSPLEYSTYFGAEISDDGRALAVSGSGIVYMAGTTAGTQLPQAGGMYRDTLAGANDAFLTRWNLDNSNEASLTYSTYLGGSGIDEVRAIALDAEGKVLLTGYTLSTDFPLGGNIIRTANGGNGDVFVMRFDPDAPRSGQIAWSTYLGGRGGDVAYSIVPVPDGTVWITGYTLSPDFPVTPGAIQASVANAVEVFAANLDPSKSGDEGIAYSTYLGAVGVNVGYTVAAAPDGNIYIGGLSAPRALPDGASGYQLTFGGGVSDGFVLVISK